MAEISEQTIIERARRGSVDAFNMLVRRYQDAVYTLAYRMLGDPAAADDAAQEAFISAYRKLDSYRGGSFKSWLLRITANLCLDDLRRVKRQRTDYLDDLAPEDSADGPPLPSNETPPEEAAEQAELAAAIQRCINNLTAEHRAVLVMSDVEGFAYGEIAAALDTQVGTVKSRLSRARLAMRRCLAGIAGIMELLPPEVRPTSDD
jgi:RNA polymerase sigma-70 factor (ECF subfamily)